MPGLLKVGYTNRDPRVRAIEIADATGVPCAYVLLHKQAVEGNAEKLEGIVHALLGDRRPSPNREFFYCTLDEAKAAIDAAVAGRKPPKEPLALAITLPDGWHAPVAPAQRLASSRAGQKQGRDFGDVGSIADMVAFAGGAS
ncbi:GIY-YIG nuclease family protein [Thalassobaculum sp. OXR-137]|nr:GIY-YIG nuclease family protein [Thalassobaculum sp. OXR-137]WPZ35525.1 GIY-YIG nuclease family protein [Thalassobaculum sp. OXR-137]